MRQAIEEGLSNMQIAILKKEYAPLKGKKITAARAQQLMNILDRFKDDDLKKLSKQNIPFVSSGSASKLAVRNMGVKVTTFRPFGSFKEEQEITQEDFNLEEGKMKTIATMFDQGKSAEEIAKAMKLPVNTVKNILGEVKEEQLHEFKKMTVTFKSMADMSKASTDLAKQGFSIDAKGMVMKVDGKGADLNKYATDLKNFYKASVRAESYTIDESADEDFYNPITEACWTGYKQVGMKNKGGKQVPNCVPESVEEAKKMKKADVAPESDAVEKKDIKEEDDAKKLENELKQKENEIAQLKQKAETDKAKSAKTATDKMVNPETGEPLLQVGIAYKHLKDKMAKDAAAKDDAKQKEEEEKKKTLAKFRDRLKENALNESDASDKAKSMGLDYMKFGRYGKDGKVTHKSIGGSLTAVDKDEKPIKEPKSKDEPVKDVKPKVDTFDARKDLENMVTDGVIDVEDDGQGGLTATKEYEPSQDYEAEQDVKSIKKYFQDKGIDEKDIYVDLESEEDYIQVNVEVRGKPVKEDVDYLKPKLNPGQIANIKKTWQDKKPGDVTPAVKNMIKNMDIPTQLAIKHANIKFLSKLVEDLDKKDEPKVKDVIKGLKKASDLHKQQHQKLTKALKTEADLTKPQIKMVHKKADELPKKDFKDRYGKDGDSVRYAVATNIIKKKQGIGEMKTDNKDHPAKAVYEQIKGLKNKAEKSGMPYGILKKVYDRGMAAWRGGHRPGTSQQQWAFARVNSFVTKSSGTWGGADKDLAAKVKGSK